MVPSLWSDCRWRLGQVRRWSFDGLDFGVSLAGLAGLRWTFWAPGHMESRPLFAVLGCGGFDFVVVCGVLWYVGYGG